MSGLYERIRNVFTDEISLDAERRLNQEKIQGLSDYAAGIETGQSQGRDEVTHYLTEKLNEMSEDIQLGWKHNLLYTNHAADITAARFEARIAAYNDIALTVHDLNNQGKLSIEQLPEILHPEVVAQSVQREVAMAPSLAQWNEVDPVDREGRAWGMDQDFHREIQQVKELHVDAISNSVAPVPLDNAWENRWSSPAIEEGREHLKDRVINGPDGLLSYYREAQPSSRERKEAGLDAEQIIGVLETGNPGKTYPELEHIYNRQLGGGNAGC